MDKNELLRVFTPSLFDVVKVILTALVILFVTKIQLVSDKFSAFLIALPLTSLLAMLWMRHDQNIAEIPLRVDKIANHA